MSTVIQPYLFFSGQCKEALEFYSKGVGAKVDLVMLHKDSPEPPPPGMLAPGFENKVMHASFRIGDSVVMASDGCGEASPFNGFSLSLSVENEDAARAAFTALTEGGEIRMPLTKTFWSPLFGMLTDRFGVGWMVGVMSPASD